MLKFGGGGGGGVAVAGGGGGGGGGGEAAAEKKEEKKASDLVFLGKIWKRHLRRTALFFDRTSRTVRYSV